MAKNKTVGKYIILSIATLLVLSVAILLPFIMAQSIKETTLNTVEVIPLSSAPTEKTSNETNQDSLKTALTLLYLHNQDESFTKSDNYKPQTHNLDTAEDIEKEIQKLNDLGFIISSEFNVNSVTGTALKNRVSDDIRADYNVFALSTQNGGLYVITDANTGQILSIEFYSPSESERTSYESMATAFAEYMKLGEITLLSQKDAFSKTEYYYLAPERDMVVIVIVSNTVMSITAYPYTLYPKGD